MDPDIALILKAKSGDARAFGELLRKYEPWVLNTLYRLLGDRPQAEDLTQKVFLKLFGSLGRYRPEAKFSTYLYTLVANSFRDALRRKSTQGEQVSLDASLEREGGGKPAQFPDLGQKTPEQIAEDEELTRWVRQAVACLPERERLALVLRTYNRRSYEEIAEVLETTKKAVEGLLYRAKANLAERMGPYFQRGFSARHAFNKSEGQR